MPILPKMAQLKNAVQSDLDDHLSIWGIQHYDSKMIDNFDLLLSSFDGEPKNIQPLILASKKRKIQLEQSRAFAMEMKKEDGKLVLNDLSFLNRFAYSTFLIILPFFMLIYTIYSLPKTTYDSTIQLKPFQTNNSEPSNTSLIIQGIQENNVALLTQQFNITKLDIKVSSLEFNMSNLALPITLTIIIIGIFVLFFLPGYGLVDEQRLKLRRKLKLLKQNSEEQEES